MIRNNESWELGEPEINERGQPVIHDIASRLGCIRPSPDLPYAFPEGADDFAELQAQLQQARSEACSEDSNSRNNDESLTDSPVQDRAERASSSESDHSNISQEYNRMLWNQQRQPIAKRLSTTSSHIQTSVPHKLSTFDENAYSLPSPVCTDIKIEPPMFTDSSPFSPWAAGDQFLGQAHALDLTAHYMKQQQFGGMSRAVAVSAQSIQMSDTLNFADGTIRPGMLDCSNGYSVADSAENIMYSGDYEMPLAMV